MADPITISVAQQTNTAPTVKDLSAQAQTDAVPAVKDLGAQVLTDSVPARKDLSAQDFSKQNAESKEVPERTRPIEDGLIFHLDPARIYPQLDGTEIGAFKESSENNAIVYAENDPALYLAMDESGEGQPAIRLQKYQSKSALKAEVSTGSKATVFAVFKRTHDENSAPSPIQQQEFAETLLATGPTAPRFEIEIKPIEDRAHLMIGGNDAAGPEEIDGWRVAPGQRKDWTPFSNKTAADLPSTIGFDGGLNLKLIEIGSDTDTLAKGSFYSGGIGVAPAGGTGNLDAAANEYLTFEFNRPVELRHILVENLGPTDRLAVDILNADGSVKRTVGIEQSNAPIAANSVDEKIRIHALGKQNCAFVLKVGEKLKFRADAGVTVLYAITLAEAVGTATIQAVAQEGLTALEFINGDPATSIGRILPSDYCIFCGVYTGMPVGTSISIGADGDEKYAQIDLRELLFYNRTLSVAERDAMVRHLAGKHRLKNSRPAMAPHLSRINAIFGAQQIGRFNDNYPANPSFGPNGNSIVDAAGITCANGLTAFKFALGPPETDSYDAALQTTITESTLLELARDNPVARAIFDTPIQNMVFWAVPVGPAKLAYAPKPLTQPYLDSLKGEWYDLAVWLRTTYAGTGRRFFFGDWEADWQLAGSGSQNPEDDISAQDISDFAAYVTARQQAIDEAKAATPASNVEVWNYTECNRGDWARDGRPGVANSVLPLLPKLDYLSWTVNPMLLAAGEAVEILETLESALPPEGAIPGQPRLMLGEYYINRAGGDDITHQARYKDFWLDLLDWNGTGIEFILLWKAAWESYDGSGRPEDSSLMDASGGLNAIGKLHQKVSHAIWEWKKNFQEERGVSPSWAETAKYAKIYLHGSI